MLEHRSKQVVLFFSTALIALLLLIVPLPHVLIAWRPQFVLLILFYWLLVSADSVSVVWLWLVGILQDLLLGTPLAMHALNYVVLAFVVTRIQARLSGLPMWQQVLMVALLSIINGLFTQFVSMCCGYSVGIGVTLLPALTNALVWPWLCACMDRLQQRHESVLR